MFGKNEIVGRKYFKDNEGKFLVTSIFYTLQGEGPLAGRPAVFVRLAKCNLACTFCDTYFDSGDWMTVEEIDHKIYMAIDEYYNGWVPDWALVSNVALVVTGGEPSLQNLRDLIDGLQFPFRFSQVESNGILYPDLPQQTILVVSPKCVEKNGKAVKYIEPNPDVLDRADALKFVICADPTSPYYSIPQWALDWKDKYRSREIYVSPMNIYNEEPQAAKTARNSNQTSLEQRSTVEEVISFWTPGLLNLKCNQYNHEYAAEICMKYGLRLNLQMHLYVGKA